jgi:uncharacterized protein YfiM (DUF2279 family)
MSDYTKSCIVEPHYIVQCSRPPFLRPPRADFDGDDQGNVRAQPGARPWSGAAAGMAVGMERRVDGSAQRHRGCLSAAFVGGRSTRLPIAASATAGCSRILPIFHFRGNIDVTDASGETRTAAHWVGRSGPGAQAAGWPRHRVAHVYQVGGPRALFRRIRPTVSVCKIPFPKRMPKRQHSTAHRGVVRVMPNCAGFQL